MFNREQKASLEAKLDVKVVKTRTQAGFTLSYIEGWHAIAEANRIFGFDRWNRETIDVHELGEPAQNEKKNWAVAYMARVRITVRTDTGQSIIREGCGFGSGFSKSVGDAHESAIKEAETDAMKRALMTFGNPFGLALYDKAQANVEKGNGTTKTAKPKEAAKEVTADEKKARDEYNRIKRAIGACGNPDDLTAFMAENKGVLAFIKTVSAARHDELIAASAKQNTDLIQKEAA